MVFTHPPYCLYFIYSQFFLFTSTSKLSFYIFFAKPIIILNCYIFNAQHPSPSPLSLQCIKFLLPLLPRVSLRPAPPIVSLLFPFSSIPSICSCIFTFLHQPSLARHLHSPYSYATLNRRVTVPPDSLELCNAITTTTTTTTCSRKRYSNNNLYNINSCFNICNSSWYKNNLNKKKNSRRSNNNNCSSRNNKNMISIIHRKE